MTKMGKRNLELILILGLLAAVGPFSIDTYLPSLPTIADELGTTAGRVQLSVSSFFLGLSVGQLFCGPLSDRFGRRPVLFCGFGAFILASLACGLSPNVTTLTISRAIQGLAAAVSPAAGRAVVRDIWSGNEAARAMSFVVMTMAVAPLLAPLIGGQVLALWSWRAIFWGLTGFGALCVFIILWRLPETNGPEKRQNTTLGAYFRAYGTILKDLPAWAYLLSGGFASAVLFTYVTGVSLVYIDQYGVDPRLFGLLFGVNVIGLFIGNWLNTQLVTRLGYRTMLAAGVLVTLLGALMLLVCVLANVGGLWGIVISLFVATGPISMVMSNAMSGLLNLFPHHAGAAAALFGVSQFGFGAIAGTSSSLFYTGTPMAMSIVMFICALISILGLVGLRHLDHHETDLDISTY